MQSLLYVPSSNQTANASLMTVQTLRSPGATTAIVNTVANVPTKFYGTMGAPHTFVDPVTGETITIISEATAVDAAFSVSGSTIVIDAIASGYTDTRGSLVGDIIVIKPITEWANNLFNLLNQSHNDNGSIKESAIVYQPTVSDYIQTGGIWSALTGFNATMTALTCYQAGRLGSVAAVATRAFTASKDTYVDILRNTTTGAFSLVYTEVANNATTGFTLAANSLRLAKVVTSGVGVTSVVQGAYDGLGNPIRSIAPVNQRQIINPYRFSAYCSTGKTISTANSIVDLQTEITDPNNNFDTTTSRYYAPFHGWYQLNASAWWGSAGASSTEWARMYIKKNGSTTGMPSTARLNGQGDASRYIVPIMSTMIELNAGDYIELWLEVVGSRDLVANPTTTYMNGFLFSEV